MRQPKPETPPKFAKSDLIWALENAAEFLEMEEFPHDEGEQESANKEGAKRIRRMAKRLTSKKG